MLEIECIDVGQFEYKSTKSPNELYSGGIGPCIVIGAIYYDKGYMFHAHSVYHNISKQIEPIFKDLRQDVRTKNNLQIYLIGGGFDKFMNRETMNEIIAGRKTVHDKIIENGFKKSIREIRWCSTDYTQSLRLILSENRAEITEDYDLIELD